MSDAQRDLADTSNEESWSSDPAPVAPPDKPGYFNRLVHRFADDPQHDPSLAIPMESKEDADESLKEYMYPAPPVPDRQSTNTMPAKVAVTDRLVRRNLSVLVCLRGSNTFIVEKKGHYFSASARAADLKHAFAIYPLSAQKHSYRIIHIESGQYCSVTTSGSVWKFCTVSHQELSVIEPQALEFNVRDLPNQTRSDLHLFIIISWRGRFLTASRGKGALLVFSEDRPGDNSEVFLMDRPKSHKADRGLKIIPLLDLVRHPRPEKCAIRRFPKVENVPMELFETIKAIYSRLNKSKPQRLKHYAPFVSIWNEFAIYSLGMVSQTVITAFDEGVNGRLRAKKEGSLLLVHITDFVYALDTVTDFYRHDIKMEKIQSKLKRSQSGNVSMKDHLKHLNSVILTEHPKLIKWRKQGSCMRWCSDMVKGIKYQYQLTADADKVRFGIMTGALGKVQDLFGESVYILFKLNRWLVMLNLVTAAMFIPLFTCHLITFKFKSFSNQEYFGMIIGNEYEHSPWFYGGFKPEYPDSILGDTSVGFWYIATCGVAFLFTIMALLKVLINVNHGGSSNDTEAMAFAFSRVVFAGYDHSVDKEWGVKQMRTSNAVQLMETMLEVKDEESQEMTRELLYRRILGVLACLILSASGFFGIATLVTREHSDIIPWIDRQSKKHSGMEVVQRITEYLVPLAVASLQFIVPFTVKKIVRKEKYSAKTRSRQIFLRVYFIRLGFLMFTMFWTARTARAVQEDPLETCVENRIGMLLYRFVETTVLVDIGMFVIVPQIRFCFTPRGCCRCLAFKYKKRQSDKPVLDVRLTMLYENGQDAANQADQAPAAEREKEKKGRESWKQTMDIPGEVVEEIYRQVVVWCGMYFCPMLPVLSAFTMTVGFYAKYLYLRQFCSKPRKASGIAQNRRLFYGMLLLGVCVSFFGFRYLIARTPICGPHQGVNVKDDTMATLARHTPQWIADGGEQIFDPMLMSFVILLLGAYASYMLEKKKTYNAGYRFFKGLLESESAHKRQLYHDWRDKMNERDDESDSE